jgi:RNA polymerase sigma-70 factor (ECF subfamily)
MESFLFFSVNSLLRYRHYLYSVARAVLDHRRWTKVDASDVVQETLLKAHKARHQFRGQTEKELAAWLRTILNHTLANSVRSSYRQKASISLSRDDESDSYFVHSGDLPADALLLPEEIAERNEQLMRLAAALTRLPDDQRVVVEMKHLYGLSVAEICERTSRSKPSVVGLLFRGLKALRVLLDDPSSGASGDIS